MNAEGKVVNEISSLERSDGDCIRKGAWSPQEDSILVHYISTHGEGRWTHLARDSGLRRTGKSCRLRWRNYLQPNIRRGNITLQEQLRIMELHCIYGNRWSKIAKFLPGRTDNEIKNYWRTRVHKQAKQLKYDINSIEFNELVRNVWVPRLSEQVQLEASRCNGIDDKIVKNYDDGACTEGFEALQMIDQCVGCSGDHAVELVAPQQDLTTDLSESKLGQNWHHSPFVDDGFKGEEGLANEFSYSELWDVQLNDNNFWTCP